MELENRLVWAISLPVLLNDFASKLKLPKQMMPAALNAVNGSPYAIDIGHFAKTGILSMAGFGAFTEVSYLTPSGQENPGGDIIRPIFWKA